MSSPPRDYFDDMYEGSDDPYGMRTRWYEERKRQLLLATLPQRHWRSIYEPGCGNGELTRALAARSDALLASDMSHRAVALARARCAGLSNVVIEQHTLPADWPRGTGRFDLIVLSEIGYFLDAPSMHAMAQCCSTALDASGTLLACDWRPDFGERALDTDQVHAALAALGLRRLVRHEEDDFLLQLWSRDGRSVAEREGIR